MTNLKLRESQSTAALSIGNRFGQTVTNEIIDFKQLCQESSDMKRKSYRKSTTVKLTTKDSEIQFLLLKAHAATKKRIFWTVSQGTEEHRSESFFGPSITFDPSCLKRMRLQTGQENLRVSIFQEPKMLLDRFEIFLETELKLLLNGRP